MILFWYKYDIHFHQFPFSQRVYKTREHGLSMSLVYDLASFDFSGMEQQSECRIWNLNRLVSIIEQIESGIEKS